MLYHQTECRECEREKTRARTHALTHQRHALSTAHDKQKNVDGVRVNGDIEPPNRQFSLLSVARSLSLLIFTVRAFSLTPAGAPYSTA